jgi:hypothetical protein
MKSERRHPSYGVLRISRMHGTAGRLYGSALREHHNAIRLEIAPSTWIHELSRDWHHGSNQPLIEIEMSAAQFAEAITSLNQYSGVPCTVRSFNGALVEPPPEVETEAEKIRSEFHADLTGMIAEMDKRRFEIEEATGKLPATTREKIRIALDAIVAQVRQNVPFILQQFEEATSKVVTAAKSEIEAFATMRLLAAGIEVTAAGAPQITERAEVTEAANPGLK